MQLLRRPQHAFATAIGVYLYDTAVVGIAGIRFASLERSSRRYCEARHGTWTPRLARMQAREFCDETGLRLHDDGILLLKSDLVYATARRQSHHGARHQHTVASGSCDAPSPAAESTYSRWPPRLHARRPDRLLQRWRHCRTACIRCDTWDPGRAWSRLTATTSPLRRRDSPAVLLYYVHNGSEQWSGSLGGPEEARDPETWAVGCQLAAGGDAMSRQLGESLASIFPTHPERSCAFLAGPAPRGLRGDADFDRLHVLLQPCQRALLWPASIQPPLHQSGHRALRALTTTGITCTTSSSSQTGLRAFRRAPEGLGRCAA